MPVGLVVESLAQRGGVDEVTIMSHADTVRAVDVKGLGLRVCAAASCGVSQMAKTHEAGEIGNTSTILEDLGGHAIALALVETTAGTAADYTSSVLSTVLEEVEGIVNLYRSGLRLGVAVDNGNDTAHFDVVLSLRMSEVCTCSFVLGRVSCAVSSGKAEEKVKAGFVSQQVLVRSWVIASLTSFIIMTRSS